MASRANRPDLTLRNLTAMKKRLVNVHQALLLRLKSLEARVAALESAGRDATAGPRTTPDS